MTGNLGVLLFILPNIGNDLLLPSPPVVDLSNKIHRTH